MTDAQLRRAAVAMQSGTHGHFAASIGDAYIAADPTNRGRLAAAFPDLFARVHEFHQPKLEIVINE
jgi:hypothetical protein